MSKLLVAFLLLIIAAVMLSGCGRIKGPRFWWDDRSQERLPEEYALPADPAAPAETSDDFQSSPSGEDLTDENLRDYRTDLDLEEEKRKSEASLFDF